MNRLALTATLASALLGTGCVVTPADLIGDLDIAWQFQNSQGVVAGNFMPDNTGCGVAAIATVRLVLRDAGNRTIVDQDFPCREPLGYGGYPRAYLSGLSAGHYTYQLTAYRSGSPAFDDTGSLDIFDSTVTYVDSTMVVTAVAPLTVYYTQQGALTCSGTPSVRYDLWNAAGTTSLETNTVACDPVAGGFTATADQPTGVSYLVDLFALNGSAQSVNERCSTTVLHSGFPVTINLLPAPDASCGP